MDPARLIYALTTAVLMAALSSMQTAAANERSEEPFKLSAPFKDVAALHVNWQVGTIKVRIDPAATELVASGKKWVQAADANTGKAALADIKIEFQPAKGQPTELTLQFTAPKKPSLSYGGDVELVVPRAVPLVIASAAGNVTIAGNAAPTTIDLAAGNVDITGQQGDTHVKIGAGNATVNATAGQVIADVKTGQVRVDSTGGDVTAETGAGAVDVQARPPAGGKLLAKSGTGNVAVHVPADFAAKLVLKTGMGNVQADLAGFKATETEKKPTQLHATLNGGGGTITAETGVGNAQFGVLKPTAAK